MELSAGAIASAVEWLWSGLGPDWRMPAWLNDHETLAWWVIGLSVLTFVGSLVAIPILIVQMPADYFLRSEPARGSWRRRHPVVRVAVLIVKNVLGLALAVAGVIMLFVPGQGILAILIGLSLVDLPGKRAFELRLIGSPTVLHAINAIRAKAGHLPLRLPEGRGRRA